MKKNSIIILSTVATAIGIQLFAVSLYHSNQKHDINFFRQHGRELTAEILELRRYFPPQGADRYARIFYQYQTPSGKFYKGQHWLSEDEFNNLKGLDRTLILFDPTNPSHSILKAKANSTATTSL